MLSRVTALMGEDNSAIIMIVVVIHLQGVNRGPLVEAVHMRHLAPGEVLVCKSFCPAGLVDMHIPSKLERGDHAEMVVGACPADSIPVYASKA